ncbi:hypothetical protein C7S18_20240 [Ahniella affigens]|uniref:Uncharacterized protein n=2 Tax=Ahniella affigens TaxID=2021234 RepID=A0A2P1PWY9_9GAMM|nr:hypothetical protein C7S18_20240 [Ahniella affigens]
MAWPPVLVRHSRKLLATNWGVFPSCGTKLGCSRSGPESAFQPANLVFDFGVCPIWVPHLVLRLEPQIWYAMKTVTRLAFCAATLVATAAYAGSFNLNYFAELEGTFTSSTTPAPGRVAVSFDLSGSQFTDLGIAAFSDPNDGKITAVARVDISNADTNLVGIALSRNLYTGAADISFGGGDGKVDFQALNITDVIDACQDTQGRFVVAASAPGASGSGGPKDMALVRFTAAGDLDLTYSSDGKAVFSLVDGGGERDEAINDLECLPGGDYFIGGWAKSGTGVKEPAFAQMPATSNHDTSVAQSVLGIASGESDGQVTAVYFNQPANAYVIAQTLLGDTLPSRTVVQHYALRDGIAFDLYPQIPNINVGIDHCPTLAIPSIIGITAITGTDYAASLLYTSSGQRHAAVARINIGESVLVSCTPMQFSLTNAGITPPLVYGGYVFIALGFAPLNGTATPSQMRAFSPSANGLSLLTESNFGTNGVASWSHTFSSSNPNNNRSFVQRLYVDPAGLIMAVGSRVWNGNDTDVVLTRLGSSGVFRNGFENPE